MPLVLSDRAEAECDADDKLENLQMFDKGREQKSTTSVRILHDGSVNVLGKVN